VPVMGSTATVFGVEAWPPPFQWVVAGLADLLHAARVHEPKGVSDRVDRDRFGAYRDRRLNGVRRRHLGLGRRRWGDGHSAE